MTAQELIHHIGRPKWAIAESDWMLAGREDLSIEEQHGLASGPQEVSWRLASNPCLAPQLQRRFATCEWLLPALAANPRLEPDLQMVVIDRLAPRAPHGCSADDLFALVMNPCLSRVAQLRMIDLLQGPDLMMLARNPALEPDLVQRLAAHAVEYVRAAVAQRADVEPGVLSGLARDRIRTVRAAAAGNPGLAPQDQLALACDGSYLVREGLAGNPRLRADAQVILADDTRSVVRSALAANPRLAPRTAARLAEDDASEVVKPLARHPALTPTVQRRLADRGPEVRAVLAANPMVDPEVQHDLMKAEGEVRRRLAQNPCLVWPLQRELAGDSDEGIRSALASNKALGQTLRRALACDTVPWVRAGIACRADLDDGLQAQLAADSDFVVTSSLAGNPALRRSGLHALIQNFVEHAGQRDYWPRSRMRGRPELGHATYWTPTDLDLEMQGPMVAVFSGKRRVLLAAPRHRDALVRLAVLANPRVPASTVAELLQDSDPDVRAAARVRTFAALRDQRCA